jgi:hypothetical protein
MRCHVAFCSLFLLARSHEPHFISFYMNLKAKSIKMEKIHLKLLFERENEREQLRNISTQAFKNDYRHISIHSFVLVFSFSIWVYCFIKLSEIFLVKKIVVFFQNKNIPNSLPCPSPSPLLYILEKS